MFLNKFIGAILEFLWDLKEKIAKDKGNRSFPKGVFDTTLISR
jgi:hypothetical protein